MFNVSRVILSIIILVLMNINFFYSSPALADSNTDTPPQVVQSSILATNPNCDAIDWVKYAFAVAIGSLVTGIAFLPIPVIGHIIGGGLIFGALLSTMAIVLAAPTYFGCIFSFVRHPVARFDKNNKQNVRAGAYKECVNPEFRVPEKCDEKKVYSTKQEYIDCIKKESNGAFNRMPQCPSQEYKEVDYYAWPKNGVPSSNYVEFCYRMPLSPSFLAGGVLILIANLIQTGVTGESIKKWIRENATDLEDSSFSFRSDFFQREADYGDDNLLRFKAGVRGPTKCATLELGKKDALFGVAFKAENKGGNICVKTWGYNGIPLHPNMTVGCHMRGAGPPAPMCEKSEPIYSENGQTIDYDNKGCYNCYIASSCYGKSGLNSKSPFPVTAVIVECIKESLKNILTGKCGDYQGEGFLPVAQKRLKNTIMAVLFLAVLLFALKASLGGIQSYAEVIILFIKFALVVHFTMDSKIMSEYYEKLITISVSLSDLVLKAGGNTTVCNYSQSEYKPGFEYLAPWDRLDCRMMFYLGSQLNSKTATIVLGTLLGAAFIIVAVLFGSQVLIALAALFAVIMMILIIIWMVYLFILSMVALTVLTVISPLIIPMSLFQFSKNFFDGWIKELITYTLYPVILFAFLSLIFGVFDDIYFEDLKFKPKEITLWGYDNVPRTTYVLEDEKACDDPSRVNNLACIMSNVVFTDKRYILGINFTAPEWKGEEGELWKKLGLMGLMGFLFYHFLSSIGQIAAELAGNPRGNLASGVTSPAQMMGKVMSKAGAAQSAGNKALRSGAGKAAQAVKSAMSRKRGGAEGETIEGGGGKG